MLDRKIIEPGHTTGCERCDAIYHAIADLALSQEMIASVRARIAFVRGAKSLDVRSIDSLIALVEQVGTWIQTDCEHCEGEPLPRPIEIL